MLQKILSNRLVIGFIAIMLVLATFKVTQYFSDKKLEAQRIEIKKLKIKNDTLKKVSDGHYQKLVADTLTKKQLRKEIEDLKLKVKDGVIVEKIVVVPKEVEKPIDSLEITLDSVSIIDYYPTKDNWFARYSAIIKLKGGDNTGKFTFSELPINLVISEQEDGTFRTDLQAPDFISVASLEVLARPLDPVKVDNFGILAGGKINRNMENGNLTYEIIGGFRFKKINIITSVNTNTEFGLGALIEF